MFLPNTAATLIITESTLYGTCVEDMNGHPSYARSGPLFAVIMLRRIQYDSAHAIQYIEARLRALDIKKIPGEDIDRVRGRSGGN